MIFRSIKDVEGMDVGTAFGLPEGKMIIQWLVSNDLGDERYRHRFAVRKYTLKPGDHGFVPFHNHKYIQCMIILSGRANCESSEGSVEASAGDFLYFYENEPHRVTPIGEEVELFCIIDCPGDGENCWAAVPKSIDRGVGDRHENSRYLREPSKG